MTYACIILPFPPSVNGIWRGRGKSRYLSRFYQRWLEEAGWALQAQKPLPTFSGPVAVTVGLGRPDKRKRDLDNVGAKVLLDLLVHHEVLSDDSLVQRLTMEWAEDVTGARVELEAA